ncbi:putative Ig domain-containing protein [Telluribacter sp. SYSU D00476]|uniref:putative Ig domain-containing protein n=1 Tax=Telluribacter sp. SYSU D00476 TaxID=2811430 RepID=UPI001FF11C34|nr:putative Ig domain-containing protein [Telluribacter sp. SYSU D00476]
MLFKVSPLRLAVIAAFIGVFCLYSGKGWSREREKAKSAIGGSALRSGLTLSTPVPVTDRPRYISICIFNVEQGDHYLPIMERAAAAGINSFQLNVNWERVYSHRGAQPTWDQYDKQVALAKRLGCKVFLRIWVARHDDQHWWPSSTIPVSNLGLKRGLLSGFSYSDENAVAEVEAFVKEVAQHFLPEQRAGHIVNIAVANNNDSELGYAITVYDPAEGRETMQVNDYSGHSVKAFNEWLQNKYKTIGNLNRQWGADFSKFDIYPPAARNYWDVFAHNSGLDWYLFRHHELKKYSDRMARAIKSVDPSYKYLLDIGSCFDGITQTRGTYGFKSLGQLADGGIKVNDGFYYDHRFSMDLLRTNLPGRMIGNEVFRARGQADEMDIYRRYFNESFEHGADWINMVGFDQMDAYPRCEAIMREMADKWLKSSVPGIHPTQTVSYKLSEAIRHSTGGVQERWRNEYNASRKPINVVLEEDLLGEVPVENKAPKVVAALTNQKGTTGNWFQYSIPKENFHDEDGYLVNVEAQGLPEGLSMNGWNIEGRPNRTGDFTVNVKVIDNLGASVSTTFTITVGTSEAPNLVSLYKAGNFLTRRFLRYIQDGDTIRISGDTQTVNIMASPRTGTVGSYVFTLSGPYSVSTVDSKEPYGLFGDNGGLSLLPGTYRLILKSYSKADMQGDVINQQVVNFVVIEGEGESNQPPFLYKTPVGLLAKVGEPFKYKLHDSTFVDLDGTIASFEITGLPDGLSASGLTIEGTPQKKGYWTSKVKATDNKGASSSTEFMFMVTADNVPPVVKQTIPDQVATVNKPFEYRIPDETFADPDGSIKNVYILGAPEGLTASGNLLSGAPKAVGTYQLIAVATDDGNLSVQTFFKINVVSEEVPNKAPVVNKPLLSLQTLAGKPYEYRLADDTFVDPDGTIASVTMTDLPEGLSWDGTVIKGTPARGGEWTVQVKATDDKDASVTTHFKFIITVENRAPVVQHAIADMTTFVNKPFEYRIPDSTFADPDGEIKSIAILGAPEGLTASGSQLSGTPKAVGTYQLIAIATDNSNVSVQAFFKINVVAEEEVPNKAPIINKPLLSLQTLAGKPYEYRLADDTFVDPDGTIASVTMNDLPEGLNWDGTVIKGTPARKGEWTVQVKATDNKGASVTTHFRFTIIAENVPPIVHKPVPDLAAKVGKAFSYRLSDSTFVDPDGTIIRITIQGAPDGLTASGSQLSGTPTTAGEYLLTATATDDASATVQTTFKLVVTKDNLPPVVANPIPNQLASVGTAFSYTLPASTFTDPDGEVVRIEITGLPAGLTASGLTISGEPTASGDFVVNVTAFDNVGASVNTTFRIRVGGVNQPPQLSKELPELVAIVGQVFHFDIKEYFEDGDGQIVSISYASTLPTGLTANGSQLGGNPTAAGSYEVKVKVKDDRDAVTEVILKIKVEKPILYADLYQPGSISTRKFIHRIANGDVLDLSKLPNSVNIFVSSNASITSVTYEITGSIPPVYFTDDTPPYFSLYHDEAGFTPIAGTYTLKLMAYNNGVLVATQTSTFRISQTGVRIASDEAVEFLPEFNSESSWKAYPNPFRDRVQLQTGVQSQTGIERVEVLTGEGRSLPLDAQRWKMNSGVLEVDLSDVATAPGMYLMRVQEANGKQRTIKLLKSETR